MSTLKERFKELKQRAPKDLKDGFAFVEQVDYSEALRLLTPAIDRHSKSEHQWGGTAAAWVAYCLSKQDQHEKALLMRQMAHQLGYNLAGAWYYHFVGMSSNDELDRLDDAETANKDAIAYYEREGDPENLAIALGRLSNILKQRAGRTCRNLDGTARMPDDETAGGRARDRCVEGVQALHRLAAVGPNLLREHYLEELQSLHRLGAQFGMRCADLSFLVSDPVAAEVLAEHVKFEDGTLTRVAMTQLWNLADGCRNQGERANADYYFSRMLELQPPNPDGQDAAYRSMALYNRSVNLLVLHQLEGLSIQAVAPGKMGPAQEILRLWQEFQDLASKLTGPDAVAFCERWKFDVAEALAAVRRDSLMR